MSISRSFKSHQYTPNTPIIADCSPFWDHDLFQALLDRNLIVYTLSSSPWLDDVLEHSRPAVHVYSNSKYDQLGDITNCFGLYVDTSANIANRKAYYYDSAGIPDFNFKLSRDTLIRLLDPWSPPSITFNRAMGESFILSTGCKGRHVYIYHYLDSATMSNIITQYVTDNTTVLDIVGIQPSVVSAITSQGGYVSYLFTTAYDLDPTDDGDYDFLLIHFAPDVPVSSMASPCKKFLSNFYGFMLSDEGPDRYYRYLSGTLSSGMSTNIRKMVAEFQPLSIKEYVDSKVSDINYTPSQHGGRTLDALLTYHQGELSSNDREISDLQECIPTTELAGRTVLKIISESDSTILNTARNFTVLELDAYKAIVDPKLLSLASDTTNLKTDVSDLQVTVSSLGQTVADNFQTLSSRISTLDSKYEAITNSLRSQIDELSPDKIKELEREIATIKVEIDDIKKNYPDITSLRSDFQTMIDQMFSVERFSRRVGYYNVPSLGQFFDFPTIIITNEASVLFQHIPKSICSKVSQAVILTDNPTMTINTMTLSQVWMCISSLSPAAPSYPFLKWEPFKTIVGYIIYTYVDSNVSVNQDGVLYYTHGPSIYV